MEAIMGDNEIDIKEAKAFVESEKLGLVDKIIGRLISRKFFVFLTFHLCSKTSMQLMNFKIPTLAKQ